MTHADGFQSSGLRVLRSAVEPELCERVRRTLEPWARRHPSRGEKYQDAWVRHRAVRELACHSRIMTELQALYGRRPIPFQTLNFARGSEQNLHADSIHFDSVPTGWMCGVWVALEDIGADQGPLKVVAGSQGVAPAVFEAVTAGQTGFDMGTYETALASRVAAMTAEEFHASMGDVLIWQADLAHGGSPVGDPGSTRWSQVTHYFFDGFTYVTPMLGDPSSGEVYLREPLIDIARRRIVSHRMDGRKASLVRLANGQTIVHPDGGRRVDRTTRATSSLRAARRYLGSAARLGADFVASLTTSSPAIHARRCQKWHTAISDED